MGARFHGWYDGFLEASAPDSDAEEFGPNEDDKFVGFDETEEERALDLSGYYDEDALDEDEWLYGTCEICAGEFWDGGSSCTCDDEDEVEL